MSLVSTNIRRKIYASKGKNKKEIQINVNVKEKSNIFETETGEKSSSSHRENFTSQM